jgi:3-phenylpropionate/trans-cinnamate dioxygenase ferredoxin subunit
MPNGYPVGTITDFPVGTARPVQSADGDDVLLCNVAQEFYAIANVCTHDGWPLDQGMLCGTEIECPRHGARFDVISGSVTSLPALLALDTYRVRLDGDDVYVDETYATYPHSHYAVPLRIEFTSCASRSSRA